MEKRRSGRSGRHRTAEMMARDAEILKGKRAGETLKALSVRFAITFDSIRAAIKRAEVEEALAALKPVAPPAPERPAPPKMTLGIFGAWAALTPYSRGYWVKRAVQSGHTVADIASAAGAPEDTIEALLSEKAG